MSRLDSDIESLLDLSTGPRRSVLVIDPRLVPLGGLRAMTVRRTLPHRGRTTIGPWCFVDHYGPDEVVNTGGMHVPPHPHTGLQTLSWLFSGVVEHHDSTGVNALVKPGTATLMTAGRGVQHSEVSTPETTMLHGVQLWVVLPEGARHQAPHCDSEPAHPHQVGASTVSVFVGSLPGFPGSLLPTYNEMSGAEIVIPAGQTLTLDVEQGHEYGVLVDTGTITIDGVAVSKHQLAYLEPGHSSLALSAGSSESVRAVVIGGAPFPENIVMWWNFIGRTHEEIEVFRSEWQDGLETGSERFGHLAHLPALPAPEMPSVRLKPRGQSTTSQS